MKINNPIPLSELVVGTVYELHARNLKRGVWNGVGFIGVREKFKQRFLDLEYPVEGGGSWPTATPLAANCTLPAGVAPQLGVERTDDKWESNKALFVFLEGLSEEEAKA